MPGVVVGSVVDFFAMVFVFAGLFFMLENLGNLPLQEPQHDKYMNLSFFDSVWFVFVTVSTVGYGDFSPRSILGQLAGGGMILIGVIFFGSKTSEISAIYRQAVEGYGQYKSNGKQHVVLTGHVSEIVLRDFACEYFHPDHSHISGYGRPICVLSDQKIDVTSFERGGVFPASKVQSLCGALPKDIHRIKATLAATFFFLPNSASGRR